MHLRLIGAHRWHVLIISGLRMANMKVVTISTFKLIRFHDLKICNSYLLRNFFRWQLSILLCNDFFINLVGHFSSG